MASILQKLLRNQSPRTTLIVNFNKRILASSTHLHDTKPEPSAAPIPFFGGAPKSIIESNPCPNSFNFYPSFSFEGFLNPISQIGHVRSVVSEEDNVSGDEPVIRADSVKKKRKKKMNKHKLKKLRKRLRRKT